MKPRSLLGCQRGAIYVEALVMIPLLVVLWTIVVFLEQGNTVDNDTVEDARYCAWRHAADRCEGGGLPRCRISRATELNGARFDGASGGALGELRGRTPYLAGEWLRPHGGVFHTSSERSLSRPFGWSTIGVRSRQTWMCQTPRARWTTPAVFLATCRHYGLDYCSLSGVEIPVGPELDVPASQGGMDVRGAATGTSSSRSRFHQWRMQRSSEGGVGL